MIKFCAMLFIIFALVSIAISQSNKNVLLKEKKAILEQLMKDSSDFSDFVVDQNINDLANEVKVKKSDLNQDQQSEFILYIPSQCGIQNCTYWIYRKIRNGYEILLEFQGYEDFAAATPLKSYTNGYHDLGVASRASLEEVYYEIYKYNGSAYKLTDCFEDKYVGRGKNRKFKRFRVKCIADF